MRSPWPSLSLLCLLLLPVGITTAAEPPTKATEAGAATPADQPAEPELTPEEKADEKTGQEAAKEVEKELKPIENSPDLPRAQAVVDRLRPTTEKPHQKYRVKIVDTPEVNALSLPGGYIYFTKGLVKAVESDDELAAVAAHEMAHICLNHARRLNARDKQYDKALGGLILASIFARSSGVDPGAVAIVGSLVKMDKVNQYGQAAELEADHDAINYLRASKQYNPVAMLTVAEGLARIDASGYAPDPGVMQTHPVAVARVEAIKKYLTELHVPLERRRVTHSLTAAAAAISKDGQQIGEIRLNDRVVFEPAVTVDGVSPLDRAQQSVETITSLLLTNLELLEISSVSEGESVAVKARDKTLFTITPADAAFHKSTVPKLRQQAMDAIQTSFYIEKASTAYPTQGRPEPGRG